MLIPTIGKECNYFPTFLLQTFFVIVFVFSTSCKKCRIAFLRFYIFDISRSCEMYILFAIYYNRLNACFIWFLYNHGHLPTTIKKKCPHIKRKKRRTFSILFLFKMKLFSLWIYLVFVVHKIFHITYTCGRRIIFFFLM